MAWLVVWVAVTVAVNHLICTSMYRCDINGIPVSLAWMCGGSSRSGGASIAGTTIGGCLVERSSRPVMLTGYARLSGSRSVGVRAGP